MTMVNSGLKGLTLMFFKGAMNHKNIKLETCEILSSAKSGMFSIKSSCVSTHTGRCKH